MAVATVVGGAAVLLAAGALVWLARPEQLMGLLAWVAGMQSRWNSGRVTEQDEEQLLALAQRLRWPVVALVFAWSFVAGAALAWARVAGG